ncbi:hypothetical protein QTN25_010497 [Entamoeba marina]
MDNDPTTPRYVHDSSDDSDYDNGTPDLPSSSSEENLPSDFPVSINKQPIHEQPIYEQPINYPHHPSYPPSSSDVITKEITQLKDEISEKDELIKQLKQKIVQLDNIASEKDNVITKSEYEIAQLKEEISEKDNIIMHSEYKITQLEKKASVTDRTPKSLNKTIPLNNVFDYGANPSFYENKSFSYQNCDVSIPSNHNKDVYYYEHQDRQELFGQSNYHTIPVYFPIPVLRDRNTYSVFFEIFPRYDKSYFVRICVTICYSSNLDPGALPNLSKLRKPS